MSAPAPRYVPILLRPDRKARGWKPAAGWYVYDTTRTGQTDATDVRIRYATKTACWVACRSREETTQMSVEHRDLYPEQYSHPLVGQSVRYGENQTRIGRVARVVSSRFGPLAIIDGDASRSAWNVEDLHVIPDNAGAMLTDAQAMQAIHELLDGTEWDASTIEDVADIVRQTGREIRDPDDMPTEEEDR